MSVAMVIDGRPVEAPEGATILDAALGAGIYIPTLCWHPDLGDLAVGDPADVVYQGSVARRRRDGGAFAGCDLCVVLVEGRPEPCHACYARVEPGMVVRTRTPRLIERRRVALARILGPHPHACLGCRQRAGCPREPCSLHVPVGDRCCPKLGRCAIERLHDHLDFSLPLPPFVRDARLTSTGPLLAHDWNLCVGCLRCVRACAGRARVGALAYTVEGGVIRVGFRAETPEASGCRFCGTCAEVCPTGAIVDRVPAFVEREGRLAPCRGACPAGIDAPRYVHAAARGLPDLAARVIRDTVPFGRVLGRVCHAPCEQACRRGAVDDPVSTRALKRHVCDAAPPLPWTLPPATGRRVAVVGSGPAGLTAAWALARKGHRATVFEEKAEAGGMLRWGIPAFRLPRDVVEDEVASIRRLGVEVRLSSRVGDAGTLRREFDAVLLATGLSRSKRLPIPGIDLPGVWLGLELLAAAAEGRAVDDPPAEPRALQGTPICLGPDTLVIGGGNVAVDVALTALRLGSRQATLVCLESAREMPAFEAEIHRARVEGVRVVNGWGPARIDAAGPRRRVEFRRCVAVFDAHGKFAPRYDESQRMSLEAATIVAAIGQEADRSFPARADEPAGLFVAGDVGGGPCSVVNAVASGRAAAASIDRFLGGDGVLPRDLPDEALDPALGADDGFFSRRVAPPEAEPGCGFREIEQGVPPGEARREAARCLRCDLRLALRAPPMPPARDERAALTAEAGAEAPEKEGVLRLYAADGRLLQIVGTASLRAELGSHLGGSARFFDYEVDPYYTKRESELLQSYIREHGKMPEEQGGLDDLY